MISILNRNILWRHIYQLISILISMCENKKRENLKKKIQRFVYNFLFVHLCQDIEMIFFLFPKWYLFKYRLIYSISTVTCMFSLSFLLIYLKICYNHFHSHNPFSFRYAMVFQLAKYKYHLYDFLLAFFVSTRSLYAYTV